MRRQLRAVIGSAWIAAAAIFGTAGTTAAAAPPPPFEDTIAQRVLACTGCHGPAGRAAADGYYPRIAGKPAGYLYNQLRNFRDGRRNYAPMTALLAPLNGPTGDLYLLEIARHFAALDLPYAAPSARLPAPSGPVAGASSPRQPGVADAGTAPPAVVTDTTSTAAATAAIAATATATAAATARPAATGASRGEALVRRGDPALRLPACAQCHGDALMGVAPAIPGLLGLPRDYLNAQLGAWRNGQRQTQSPDCMATVAKLLAPADIAALSSWLAAQPVPAGAKPVPLSADSGAAGLPLPCGGVPVVGHAAEPAR